MLMFVAEILFVKWPRVETREQISTPIPLEGKEPGGGRHLWGEEWSIRVGSEVQRGEKQLGNSAGILVLPQASAQAIKST